MSEPFFIPPVSAGSSELVSELHSEFKLSKDVVDSLEAKLSLVLPQKKQNSVLIIGGKCGLTAELLIPFCSRIDIVEEEPYLSLLRERFVNQRDVKYTFTKEGDLGQEQNRPKPNLLEQFFIEIFRCKVNVFEMEKFYKSDQGQHSYNIILLQNVLINEKMNILEELLRIEHEVLITMINPGKLFHDNLYGLLAGIEKNILKIFYEHILHERLQNVKHITGRRQEILFWEIFIWKRKPAGQEGSMHIIQEIKKLLQKEIEQNIVQKKKSTQGFKVYETQQLVDMYMDFHYDDEQNFAVKNFPLVCGQKALKVAKEQGLKGRALDIGCAVGRTSIELASHFDEVIGIDLSNAFIAAANNVLTTKYANLSNKVKFIVGDACKLQQSLGKFSLIFGGNLIDRLYNPEAFLLQVAGFLETNGVLILTSPYSWLEQYTPKEKWIGGYTKDGKPISTPEGLRNVLCSHGFKELHQPEDVRFVIKENPWVFQYTLANMTFWKKIQ